MFPFVPRLLDETIHIDKHVVIRLEDFLDLSEKLVTSVYDRYIDQGSSGGHLLCIFNDSGPQAGSSHLPLHINKATESKFRV